MIAQTRITQCFENPSKEMVDGLDVFPLPEDGVVETLKMTFGDRTIDGVFQESYEARQTFEDARRRGLRAALIERQESGVFATSVANLSPGETVEVFFSLRQVVRWEQGRFSLKVPWPVAPGSEAGQEGADLGKHWKPEATESVEGLSGLSPKQADEILDAMLELGPRHPQVSGDTSLVAVDEAAAAPEDEQRGTAWTMDDFDNRNEIAVYKESMPAEILQISPAPGDPENALDPSDPWEILQELADFQPPPD
jgi:hypothetical protein